MGFLVGAGFAVAISRWGFCWGVSFGFSVGISHWGVSFGLPVGISRWDFSLVFLTGVLGFPVVVFSLRFSRRCFAFSFKVFSSLGFFVGACHWLGVVLRFLISLALHFISY